MVFEHELIASGVQRSRSSTESRFAGVLTAVLSRMLAKQLSSGGFRSLWPTLKRRRRE